MLNQKDVQNFVDVRNKAQFHTNLQFLLDASMCGFKASDLGVAQARIRDGYSFCYWELPFGILVERDYKLRLFNASPLTPMQKALMEIVKYKYTGNCYLETGRGSDRVFVADPDSQDDREAYSYSKSSSRWAFLGYHIKGVKQV